MKNKPYSKSIVKDSIRFMILMGILIGVAFIPFADFVLHLPKSQVHSLRFIVSTISAGIMVGIISFFVINFTILKKLKEFENNIETITNNIFQYQTGKVKTIYECQNCYLKIVSSDILGKIAVKYNSLIRVIRSQFWQHEALEEFSTKISTINLTQELNKALLDFLGLKLNLIGSEIYILKSGELNLLYSKGILTELTPNRKKLLANMIKDKKRITLRDNEVEIIEFGTGRIKPKEINYFPLQHGNKAWLLTTYSNHFLSRERKSLIEKMLNEYKFAYESAEMYEKIQKIAAYDELTGIYNRRFGMRRLTEECKRAARTGNPLTFIMFDIDHFKKVNDTYGHQAGDFILASFGKILSKNFRAEDVVMRYGGEEFLCAIGNSSLEDTFKKADTIRKIVEDTDFQWHDIMLHITVSGGVSSLETQDGKTKTLEEAIKEADEALYKAKRSGRNRIIKHASL